MDVVISKRDSQEDTINCRKVGLFLRGIFIFRSVILNHLTIVAWFFIRLFGTILYKKYYCLHTKINNTCKFKNKLVEL